MSIFGLLFVGMARGGAFVTGFAAEWIGTSLAVGIGAVVSIIFGIYVFIRMPHAQGPEPNSKTDSPENSNTLEYERFELNS